MSAPRKRLDWSRRLPRPLIVPTVMKLRTLAGVRTLLSHLPKEHRDLHTWEHVAARLQDAAAADIAARRERAKAEVDLAHSMTCAATISDVGTVRPSALAVLRLMTTSNSVGSWIGRSAGLAPFRTRSTYPAALRNCLTKSLP